MINRPSSRFIARHRRISERLVSTTVEPYTLIKTPLGNDTELKTRVPPKSSSTIDPASSAIDDYTSLESYKRLSQAYRILGSGSKFEWSALKCSKLYESQNKILFEDLFLYPRVNNDMITYLNNSYATSKSIRALVLNDALKMLISGNIQGTVKIFHELNKHKRIHPIMKKQLLSIEIRPEQSEVAEFLVLHTVLGGDSLMAVAYAKTLTRKGLSVGPGTIDKLVRSLIIEMSPKHINYNSYTIFKIMEDYKLESFSNSLLLQVLHYLSKNNFIYFTNQFFLKLCQSPTFPLLKQDTKFNESVHEIILLNLQQGNYAHALQLWQDHYEVTLSGSTKQIELIVRLMKDSPSVECIDLILKRLPEELKFHDEILDLVLEHYGVHSPDMFNDLVKQLSNPLRRSTVSVLFKVFLHQKKQIFSEKMLELIFKSSTGLTTKDYNNIVLQLLGQGNLDQCINMLKSTDVQVSKLAYISVLQEILVRRQATPESLAKYHDFFKELSVKFLMLKEDDLASELFVKCIIEYISSSINNRLARSTFTNLQNAMAEPSRLGAQKRLANFQSVGLIDDFNVLMRSVSMAYKIQCIEVISKQAIGEEDLSVIKWSIEELRYLGLSLKEIIPALLKYDQDGFLVSVLDERLSKMVSP